MKSHKIICISTFEGFGYYLIGENYFIDNPARFDCI